MHEGAARRLHELTMAILDEAEVNERGYVDIRIGNMYRMLETLGEFVAKSMGEWVEHDNAAFYAYLSIRNVLRNAGYAGPKQILRDITTKEQRAKLAQKVCDHWAWVPRDYTFTFPLPGMQLLTESISICTGVTLENAEHSDADNESLIPVSDLFDATKGASTVPCLRVVGKGLIELGQATEVPAVSAIRLAKIVIQLGQVEGIMESVTRSASSARNANYSTSMDLTQTSSRITLPPAFANALCMISIKELSLGDALSTSKDLRFARIGQVIELDAKRRDATQATNKAEVHLIQHCARIATAAEWLFDAMYEPASAIAFVQVAIGFETLYGGEKDEPVKQTLSNRVAYSVGESPAEREELATEFVKFYTTRSKVVHTGASRLSWEQRQQLDFGKDVLKRCLQHELSLIPDVNSRLVGALTMTPEKPKQGIEDGTG
jgi:hypothetical protein